MQILFVPNPSVFPELTEAQRERIRAAAGEPCEIVIARLVEDQIAHAPHTDIVFGELKEEAFARAERLRWIQGLGAGGERMLYPAFRQSPVPLVTNKGLVGSQIAEHAFALLLALTRGIVAGARRHEWLKDPRPVRMQMRELNGLTMGVLGLGGIGRAVADRAHAFGMTVIATNPSEVPCPPSVAEVWRPDRFFDLLAVSDVVTICCPLTPATRGLFSRAAFERMKRSAILINVTRGQIMDETALIEALQQGLIAGAGLDVTPVEPLPPNSGLWEMDNVILTSHTAGASQYGPERSVDRLCENLGRWRRGEPLVGMVDKEKGY